jgi:phage gp46-like protein
MSSDPALELLIGGLGEASGLSLTTRGLLLEAQLGESALDAALAAAKSTDIALAFDALTLTADVSIERGQLATEHGLLTAVMLSLFTDRLAEDDDALPFGGSDRRGWWGDAVPPVPGDRIGSRLWLLHREKQTRETRLRAEEYAREALGWLVEDQVAERLEVEAEWIRSGILGLRIAIHRPRGEAARLRFAIAWEGVR